MKIIYLVPTDIIFYHCHKRLKIKVTEKVEEIIMENTWVKIGHTTAVRINVEEKYPKI